LIEFGKLGVIGSSECHDRRFFYYAHLRSALRYMDADDAVHLETYFMLITHVLSDFLSNHFPGWKIGDVHLELKEKTLRIVCESVETQRQIFGDSSTLSRLDIGVDLFLVCCTGHPSLGIHRCHHC
jgi:hypothetical protein